MQVNIENCYNNGKPRAKEWLLGELVKNLKELRDRTRKLDMSALPEFFDLFVFNDSRNGGIELAKAIQDVLSERHRQISAEGWTPDHDDEHVGGELADAAACYALGVYSDRTDAGVGGDIPPYWPKSWDTSWWRPKSRRRNLVRAAALLIAEIERLDRADHKPAIQGTPNHGADESQEGGTP